MFLCVRCPLSAALWRVCLLSARLSVVLCCCVHTGVGPLLEARRTSKLEDTSGADGRTSRRVVTRESRESSQSSRNSLRPTTRGYRFPHEYPILLKPGWYHLMYPSLLTRSRMRFMTRGRASLRPHDISGRRPPSADASRRRLARETTTPWTRRSTPPALLCDLPLTRSAVWSPPE